MRVIETNQNKRMNLFLLIIACVYYLADTLLPVVQYLSSVYIQIFMILLIILMILTGRNNSRTIRFIIPFLPFLTLQLIERLLNRADSIRSIIHVFYATIVFVIPAVICFYLIINNYRKTIRVVLIMSIIFLLMTSITSINGLISDPMASKVLARGNLDKVILMTYYKKNIGGFSISYMIPILLPMLIASYRKKEINIIHFVIIGSPLVYFVYITQYATALLMLIISLLSFIFANKYSFKKFVLLTIAVGLFFLLARPLIGQMLYFIADNNSSYMISARFYALGDTMMGIKSTTDAYVARVNTYQTSIDAFFSSPILGSFLFGGRSGGHSFILDTLALYGVIGIIALFLLYRQIYRFFYKPFNSQSYYGYMLWSLISSFILAFLNPTPSMFAISLFAPFVAYSLQSKRYTVKPKGGELE